MGSKHFPIAGSLDDELVAGVGESVQGDLPRMGSSKRLSHSSTARLLVMTKLETRCRLIISS